MSLKREKYEMPEFVLKALQQAEVLHDYIKRPDYQQNDYIGWIMRARQESTRFKRLQQMIDELKQGGVYMKMEHPASKKTS